MKKVMLILAMMLSVMSVNAQFVEYKPVYTNPPVQQYSVPSFGLEMPQMPQPTEEYTDVGAYYIKNNQVVRVKIRVRETYSGGRRSLTVVGYYGGPLDSLLRTHAFVSKVVRNLDGEVVANNFEWKANTAPFGKFVKPFKDIGIEVVMDRKCGSIIFFSSGKLQCLFGGNFIKVSLLEEIIEEKFGGIKKISYFCNRVMSERKRTGTMKALVNERIERYLAIEMWKFQSLLTINRQ